LVLVCSSRCKMQQALRGSGRGGEESRRYNYTAWSDWEWSDVYCCQVRCQQDENGDWKYEYRQTIQDSDDDVFDQDPNANVSPVNATASFGSLQISGEASSGSFRSSKVNCTWPTCSETFIRISDRDRHYQTTHANHGNRPYKCLFEGCPAITKSWARADKLRAHNKEWHGPYHCGVEGCPRAFPHGLSSQKALDAHEADAHSMSMPTSTREARESSEAQSSYSIPGSIPSVWETVEAPSQTTPRNDYTTPLLSPTEDSLRLSTPTTTSTSMYNSSSSYYTPPFQETASIPSNEPRWIKPRDKNGSTEKLDTRRLSNLYVRL
jgi:hypothetical protein